MRIAPIFLLALLLAALAPDAAAAAARRDGGGAADPRLQAMVQQLTTEKTALEKSKNELEAELEKLKADLERGEKDRAGVSAELQEARGTLAARTAEKEGLAGQNGTLRQRLTELAERYRELADAMAKADQTNAQMVEMNQAYEERVATCETHNQAMQTIVFELIDLYEQKGVMAALREREPVTGITRARVENMMGEYRDLADAMALAYPQTAGEPEAAEAAQTDGERDGD